jgi:hypothetical protein
MICDFDDFHESNTGDMRLSQLKQINPGFVCTLFAVPALGSPEFWWRWADCGWVQLVPHGWTHPDAHECQNWTYDEMVSYIERIEDDYPQFQHGFKAPGWQISDDVYRALLDKGWWVADQHLEDGRRPAGLPTYFYEDSPDRWHGHIQNVCGNGLEERWGELVERVRGATHFEWCSQALSVGHHPDSHGAGAAAAGVQGQR